MANSVGPFERYLGTNPDKRFSQFEWDKIELSLQNLLDNATIAGFISSILAAPPITIYHKAGLNPEGEWLQSEYSIRLTSSIINGFILKDNNNIPFIMSLERILFHEIMHARYADTESAISPKLAYEREERNVFLENTLFVDQFGGAERVGHGGVVNPSASAVSYLHGLNLLDPGNTAIFTLTDTETTIVKNYESYDKAVTASGTYTYDHYITIDFSSANNLLSEDGSILNARLEGAVDNAMATNKAALVTAAAGNVAALELNGYIQDSGFMFASTGTQSPDIHFFSLNQQHALLVSAEAFDDQYPAVTGPYVTYYGPADVGTTSAPPVLAINGQSSAGTILFGGSGYNAHSISAPNMGDDLMTGVGDDLLIAGNSSGIVTNLLTAGAGYDILVGGTGRDTLIGGDGGDLLTGGGGADVLVGGAGYDIASYASSTAGVIIDLRLRDNRPAYSLDAAVGRQTAGVDTDATGDHIGGVEAIVGSAFRDILYSDSLHFFASEPHGLTLYGGAGNDGLYGGKGDILIGGTGDDEIVVGADGFSRVNPGPGEDSIYIEATLGDSRVIIVNGGDALDHLYWNGWAIANDATLTLIDDEKEYDEAGDVVFESWVVGVVNSQSMLFRGGVDDNGGLDISIRLPDFYTATILLDDFVNGDYGLTFSAQTLDYFADPFFDLSVDTSTLPTTWYCQDGIFQTWADASFLDQSCLATGPAIASFMV